MIRKMVKAKDKPAKLITTDSIVGIKIIDGKKTTTKYDIWGFPLEIMTTIYEIDSQSGKNFDAVDGTIEEFYFDPEVKPMEVAIKNNSTIFFAQRRKVAKVYVCKKFSFFSPLRLCAFARKKIL